MSPKADGPAHSYLVHGDDPALVGLAVAELLDKLVSGSSGGAMPPIVEEYGPGPGASPPAGGAGGEAGGSRQGIDLGPVLDACITPPFLADRRIVTLRHAGLLDAAQVRKVAQYLADPLPSTSLVLVADDRKPPAGLVKAVQASGRVIDTTVKAGARARADWFDAHLQGAPVRLAPDARALLVENLGEDLSRLPGLLAMLASAYGAGAQIAAEKLRPFLGEAGELAPWDLTDAVDAGDIAKAIEVLHRLLDSGDRHALVVLATLHRHFGGMLRLDGIGVADDNAAGSILGMNRFPAGKILRQSHRLGHDKVAKAIILMAETDLDLRGRTDLPAEAVMEILVARLAQLSRPSAGRQRAGRR